VLFAPGPQNLPEIKTLVEAVAPKPLNLLVIRDIGMHVREIAGLGVRRISVGGALALAAWTGFIRAATTLRSDGSFAGLADLVSYLTSTTSLAAVCGVAPDAPLHFKEPANHRGWRAQIWGKQSGDQ